MALMVAFAVVPVAIMVFSAAKVFAGYNASVQILTDDFFYFNFGAARYHLYAVLLKNLQRSVPHTARKDDICPLGSYPVCTLAGNTFFGNPFFNIYYGFSFFVYFHERKIFAISEMSA